LKEYIVQSRIDLFKRLDHTDMLIDPEVLNKVDVKLEKINSKVFSLDQ
jgi:hypothetical protein